MRPKMLKVDAETQRLSALVEADVTTWPEVTVRAMFGMRAFYRGRTIFAAGPWTRTMRTANALIVKLPKARETHAVFGRGPGADWATFALDSAQDVPEALRWISRAYDRARPAKAAKKATNLKRAKTAKTAKTAKKARAAKRRAR
jgi:hypothetical protein